MEIFTQNSIYITKLISDFQNNKIDINNLNKNILVSTIFSHYFLKKENKKNIQIKSSQNNTFQSFFKVEYIQEQNEKQLLSNVKDRKSKKIILESIKEQRDNLLQDLSQKKDIKIFVEQTFNTYIVPKNISLSLNFQSTKNNNNNKKYIPESNIEIKHINPNLNDKYDKIISNNFIESPFYQNFNFNNNDGDGDDIKGRKGLESYCEDGGDDGGNTIINENDEFFNMINNENDEILFYDEKLGKNEKIENLNLWTEKINEDDVLSDFQDLKHKMQKINKNASELYNTLQKNELIHKEMEQYLKNSEMLYQQISEQNHFHEFVGYLSEKCYKMYIKKMNYSYLILMLLFYFDYEKFSNNYYEIIDEKESMVIFIKKILLFSGITSSKVYDSIIHVVSNKKEINFEEFLSCFLPIFDLSEKYQYYKYVFLLFLVKKSDKNEISLSNYSISFNLIRDKLIYEPDTCDNIIGKLLPIIKSKYPKDDTDNLNYQNIAIILEFFVNYEYGD